MEPPSPSTVDDTIISPSRRQAATPSSLEQTPEPPGVSETERYYETNGRTQVGLITLCIGQKTPDGKDLIDVDEEPWKTEAKSSIKPKAKDLKEEVKRRAAIINLHPQPRPNAWSVPELMEWLMVNLVQGQQDVRFLLMESERIRNMMLAAQIERQVEVVALQGADWRGNVPYLRLVHCLLEDDIKPAYLRRHEPWSREMLDSRNSESRPPTVYEIIADRWNSIAFNPSTEVSQCHFDFSSQIGLDHVTVITLQPATARKVEDKLTQIRATLTRIIAKWEKSGQGDGGRLDSDDEEETTAEVIDENNNRFGVLSDRPQFALDTRSAFLQGKPSYLLYFWEIVDKYGLLSTCLQKMNIEVSAVDGAAGVPIISATSRSMLSKKRDLEEAQLSASIRESSKVQVLVSNTELKAAKELHMESRLAHLRDDKRRIRREVNELRLSDNPCQPRIQNYLDELQDLDDEMSSISTRLVSLDEP